MIEKILIFPAGMPRSLEFLEKCQREGKTVIGASSIIDDSSQAHYSFWEFLPFVVDIGFEDALKKVIVTYEITQIYTPNSVVYAHLMKLLPYVEPKVNLINEPPLDEETVPYRTAWSFAQSLIYSSSVVRTGTNEKSHLSVMEIASIFRHAQTIPGMCDHEKIEALYEISRHCPVGDIIEIGSWWGKSAFVLLQLGRLYEIGHVLCVDPWADVNLKQDIEIVDAVSAQCSTEEAFNIFRVNLLPYVANNLNYLRLPSTEGARYYHQHRLIYTSEFKNTLYNGQIAILHIDGNHSYELVKADIQAWAGFVKKEGWIIFDDYIWPFGDGPKCAGDEFLSEHANKIAAYFVKGSALFVQISDIL